MPTITADDSTATYQDAIDRLLTYCNLNGQNNPVDAVRQAVLDMYDEIVNDRNWSYLNRAYRMQLSAPVEGTCSYSASTGQFTIDASTWPTWAEGGIIEVESVRHFIKTRTSSTVLTADDTIRPLADIVTGTAFTLYRCVYKLPFDCKRVYRPLAEGEDSFVESVTFARWLEVVRYADSASGSLPWTYAVAADPYEPMRRVLLLDPCGQEDITADFAYQRYPRALKYDGHATHCRVGTITAAASTSITGTSTTFESGMVGSILRVARSAAQYPSGRGTANEYYWQTYIAAVGGATALTTHDAVTATANKYTISDPLDLDRSLMNAFWRGCEWRLAQRLKLANAKDALADYEDSLTDARGGDNKTSDSRSAWGSGGSSRIGHRVVVQLVADDD